MAPTVVHQGFATMMAAPRCRHAYLNTTKAILNGPSGKATDDIVEALERAQVAFFLDRDETLAEPSLLILDGRCVYLGKDEIDQAIEQELGTP